MLRKRNILLIEDNEIDIELITSAFDTGKFDNDIKVIMDGVSALQYLKKEGEQETAVMPDIILMDLNIPHKSGMDLIREIKTIEYLKRIPIIVLTSSDVEWDVLSTYDFYANCFIKKPSTSAKLLETIQSIENFWCHTVQLPPKSEYI